MICRSTEGLVGKNAWVSTGDFGQRGKLCPIEAPVDPHNTNPLPMVSEPMVSEPMVSERSWRSLDPEGQQRPLPHGCTRSGPRTPKILYLRLEDFDLFLQPPYFLLRKFQLLVRIRSVCDWRAVGPF